MVRLGAPLQGVLKDFFDPRRDRGWPASLLLCVASVALAAILRIALGILLGPTLPFATFFPAVTVTALYCGTLFGILAIVLSIVVVWWVIFPPLFVFQTLTPVEEANFALFGLSGLLVVWLAVQHRTLLIGFRQQEAERQLLVGELQHRGKNILAVVFAVIRQTIKDRDLYETLVNRVTAVTNTSGILDEVEATNLRLLLEDVLTIASTRVVLEGPDVILNSGTTRAFRLVFHEMLTNTLKHGALSHEKGRVTVDWSVSKSLVIDWCEVDGPKVAPPTKYNFGSRLITRMLSQLGAQFEPRFPETGYCYKITLPLAALARQDQNEPCR
jgi:two-component sensor histidine kinase